LPRLSELLAPILPEDPEIGGLTADSREVRPGDLFAALPGTRVDGREFISDALKRGASAVLAPLGTGIGDAPATLVIDSNPQRRFAQAAARFFAPQPGTVAAVTGTNGKTSVANFTRQIWAQLGMPAASLGTLGLAAPGRVVAGSMTTPDPVNLHRTLGQLARDGVTHVAMEASSHGLDQFRLDGVVLTAAAFTNLTRDHLDYHHDMEGYWRAKRRLFTDVMAPRHAAVVNADSPYADDLVAHCRRSGHRIFTYGLKGEAIRLARATPTAQGQDLELVAAGGVHRIHLPLAGAFQAANAACALGLVLACDGTLAAKAIAALEKLEGVPGRLQHVATTPAGAAIYVDYAHTPDALTTILAALRPHAARRLIVVFGCGGDRDAGKRPVMGRIAAEMADVAIVTDDNPRSEDPAAIRAQVLAGAPGAREIGDRHEAIRIAVRELGAGDVLVLAGKGHESGQILKDRTLPFDDAVEARRMVAELGQ
jgi:UDP-N-acetylmuramoyl-L-alanyl-D-glutamate--2,6-diaminopimelate ligase